MPRFIFTFYPLLILYVDMAWAKVRWISTIGFEEILWGAYVGGEGTNGSEGRARLTGRRARQGGRRAR